MSVAPRRSLDTRARISIDDGFVRRRILTRRMYTESDDNATVFTVDKHFLDTSYLSAFVTLPDSHRMRYTKEAFALQEPVS